MVAVETTLEESMAQPGATSMAFPPHTSLDTKFYAFVLCFLYLRLSYRELMKTMS
jgi:hypothetical protein